jgi:M6 family metalloprotease-like protein
MNLYKTVLFVALVTIVNPGIATETPQHGRKPPDAYFDRLRSNPNAFQFKNGFLKLTATALEGREKIKRGAAPLGILSEVKGHKNILVLLVQFKGTQTNPYEDPSLKHELFGRSTAGIELPGTLGSYYRENSYGKLSLNGDVRPWKRLAHDEAYYAGSSFSDASGSHPCFGMCAQNSKVAELVEEAVRMNDDPQRWAQYDDDGPDDIPNSIDDDGKVDFVVIVHPGKGAECEDGSQTGLWSHHDLLSNWENHSAYVTKTKSNSKVGGNIQVDDYVLVPAVACDGTTPIQIGVIAHEFGHSLGLPDLYDTSQNPKSEGLGNWDLMAGGSWGGDGQSPEKPVQLSAWPKSYLGWVRPKDVAKDTNIAALTPVEANDDVYLVTISPNPNVYYLISNRQKIGFDAKLPGSGLFILRVDEGVLNSGLKNNNVNIDPQNMGVAVIEADGLNKLIHQGDGSSFGGGPGDTFPATGKGRNFDNTTTPATSGLVAICNISDSGNSMSFGVFVSRGTCPAVSERAEPKSVTILELVATPQKYVNRTVIVRGLLENEVSNYFRDPTNLTLSDDQRNKLSVFPWVPKEVPPGLHGPGPPTLSQFVDHEIEFIGRLQYQPNRDKYILQVDSARIIR